jgi:dienelactone hydrolase
MLTRRFTLIAAFAVLCSSLALAQDSAPDPEKPGPYPVGVTTMQFVDHSRVDVVTKKDRSLLTEIWYPATDDSKGLPKNRLLDFFNKGTDSNLPILFQLAFKVDLNAIDATFKNFAVRDARIRDGKFPLILFSHGNGGMRSQGVFLCEHLASHGYIVAAPDHTANSAVTFVDGELVAMNPEIREQAATDRPLDIRFLIDAFDKLNKGADSRFLGRVDMDKIGVSGHSFGGYTSTWVADIEPRVDAIVPLAGCAKERVNYTMPVMVMVGTEDDTIKLEGNDRLRKYYDESKGPHYLVEFKNGGHYSFTEMYQFKPDFGDGVGEGVRLTDGQPVKYVTMDVAFPIINGYTTAFLGKYVKGVAGYEGYLGANRNEKELVVKSEPAPEPASAPAAK